MSTNYFIADLHLRHDKLAKLRGFNSIEEHDKTVLDALRSVDTRSPIWILGDICSGSGGSTREALDKLHRIKFCRSAPMHLITGNHDLAWPGHRDSHKWQRGFMEVFDSVQPFARRKMRGRDVMLSHLPYSGDHSATDRHSAYRLRDLMMPVIHGHTHGTEKLSISSLMGNRQVCVSWEAWERPVAQHEIEELIFGAS